MIDSQRLHALATARLTKSTFAKDTLNDAHNAQWTEKDQIVCVRDGTPIPVLLYRPVASPVSGAPAMVFSHSGGFCLGRLETEEFLCRVLVARLPIILVSVNIDLPRDSLTQPVSLMSTMLSNGCFLSEHRAVDIANPGEQVADNAKAFGGDLAQGFLTGGVSGGGNLTNIATILARDEALQPSLTGHLYIYTGMIHQYSNKAGKSVNRFPDQLERGFWAVYKDGPLLTRRLNTFYADLAECDPDDPLLTPLHLTVYSNLGAVFYQVSGMDLWKDSAFFYSDKVETAGGRVRFEVYPGVPHTWWSMYPELSINRKWVKNLVEGVDWLLTERELQKIPPRLRRGISEVALETKYIAGSSRAARSWTDICLFRL